MNEVIREFLIETVENLAQLDVDLISLEKDPTERDTLARVFRTLHTVKGTAGFLGLQKLQAVTHSAESLLSQLRDGELLFNGEIASALLMAVDAVRQMLEAVETSETDGGGDFSKQIENLDRLRLAPVLKSSAVPQPAEQAPIRMSPPVAGPSRTIFPLPNDKASATSIVMSETLHSDIGEVRPSAVSDSTIRVDVGLLDELMTLVGELVLARNQIMQFSPAKENSPFLATVQRLDLLTTELQAGVMKTRMQPIGTIWSKFPRVVRDLAMACGKQARIDLEGQETELDRTIIEAIRDPLTHLVRNSVDHGIESPAERIAKGKTAEGRIALHAFHEGGKVIIELADDGAGIDPSRVRAKAIQAKLVTIEQADHLNERDLIHLIFLPGFSTAEQVTQFSGRGVGMDVVRTNIEKIGGSVTIDSRAGEGTTVRMKIPLTLAIIPALTITTAGDRYAIPQVNLLELVRLEGEQARRGVERIHGVPVYRLRGNLLPLVYLNSELHPARGTPSARNGGNRLRDDDEMIEADPLHIVVLQADDRQFGLVVDAIHDTVEIVVKPLQKQLKGIGSFAGATIMGDGKVALILDVLGIAQKAKVVSGVRERSLGDTRTGAAEAPEDRQTVLLFATREGRRMAIPLSQVARLEVFPRSALERVGPQDVVQYRDEILPLIHISRALRKRRYAKKGRLKPRRGAAKSSVAVAGDTIQVVVYSDNGRRVGLVVDCILDIVEETLVSRSDIRRRGVSFTAVIQGRVTEFLDVQSILDSGDPDLIEPRQTVAAGA